MKDFLIRIFMTVNSFIIRVTRGRVGAQLGTQTILLLHTIGRKSGQLRVTPIAYFHYEGRYLIVESNWGKDLHADWYFNLNNQPQTSIEVNGETIPVKVGFAEGDEYVRLWEYVTKKHPPYLNYQKMTQRKIPIMVLQPIE
jgi:deazaflavin-dependent oxidoreductase (nitroreductase family)